MYGLFHPFMVSLHSVLSKAPRYGIVDMAEWVWDYGYGTTGMGQYLVHSRGIDLLDLY